MLVAQAGKPTRREVLDRAARRASGRFSFQEAADLLREERAAR